MQTSNAQIVEVLNDIIAVNNDRITGYERALKELGDGNADLKPLFLAMIDESREIKVELGREIEVYKGDIDPGTTTKGKIYRVWMDIKAMFTGSGRHAILENCELTEDAVQQAYQQAVDTKELPGYLLDTLYDQQQMLKASHNEIKAFRDNQVHA
jgi:uncharacterized protein (TIGR02284 family)